MVLSFADLGESTKLCICRMLFGMVLFYFNIILMLFHVDQVLWPNDAFFIKLRSTSSENTGGTSREDCAGPSSFELQLEAARRASDVKKMLLGRHSFRVFHYNYIFTCCCFNW